MSFMFKPGDILENRYEVLQCLSSGRFSEVYRVSDRRSGVLYVLKVFKKADEEFSEYLSYSRKLEEYLAALHIRELICVIDTGEIAGLTYQLFHYVENARSLESIIISSAPLDPMRVLEITMKVANVLHRLHDQNIIHGDVKPQNILLDSTESDVFLIDFGMVQPIRKDLTVIYGTLRYMHPALTGRSSSSFSASGRVTSSTHGFGAYIDIYALGVTMMRMLAGEVENGVRLPFSERQLGTFLQRRNPVLGTIGSEILDQLANMIFQMLTIRPEEEGITARTVSSICTTIIRHLQEKNVTMVKNIKPVDTEPQEHVSENLMKVDQGVRDAVLRLRSIAESLNTSTVMMIHTAERLEMVTTKESDSSILEELNRVFNNALGRTRTSWMVAMIMMIVCFLTIIVMISSAVLLTIITGASSWNLIFGGLGVSAVVGTLIWRPYHRVFRATILAQQLEMIHVQTIAAFRGSTDIKYRIRICREATDKLQTLLEQHATIETRTETAGFFKRKSSTHNP